MQIRDNISNWKFNAAESELVDHDGCHIATTDDNGANRILQVVKERDELRDAIVAIIQERKGETGTLTLDGVYEAARKVVKIHRTERFRVA